MRCEQEQKAKFILLEEGERTNNEQIFCLTNKNQRDLQVGFKQLTPFHVQKINKVISSIKAKTRSYTQFQNCQQSVISKMSQNSINCAPQKKVLISNNTIILPKSINHHSIRLPQRIYNLAAKIQFIKDVPNTNKFRSLSVASVNKQSYNMLRRIIKKQAPPAERKNCVLLTVQKLLRKEKITLTTCYKTKSNQVEQKIPQQAIKRNQHFFKIKKTHKSLINKTQKNVSQLHSSTLQIDRNKSMSFTNVKLNESQNFSITLSNTSKPLFVPNCIASIRQKQNKYQSKKKTSRKQPTINCKPNMKQILSSLINFHQKKQQKLINSKKLLKIYSTCVLK